MAQMELKASCCVCLHSNLRPSVRQKGRPRRSWRSRSKWRRWSSRQVVVSVCILICDFRQASRATKAQLALKEQMAHMELRASCCVCLHSNATFCQAPRVTKAQLALKEQMAQT